MSAHRGTDVISAEDRDVARENERLLREVCILRGEGTTNPPYNPLKRRRKKSVKISKKRIVSSSVTQDCAARKRHGCQRDGGYATDSGLRGRACVRRQMI